MLALLQGLTKLTGGKDIMSTAGKAIGGGVAAGASGTAAGANMPAAAPLMMAPSGFTGPLQQDQMPAVLPGLEQYLAPQAAAGFVGPVEQQNQPVTLAGLEQYLSPVQGDAYMPAMEPQTPMPLAGLEQYLVPDMGAGLDWQDEYNQMIGLQ